MERRRLFQVLGRLLMGVVMASCSLLARGEQSDIQGLAKRAPGDLLPTLKALARKMGTLPKEDKARLLSEVETLLGKLPVVTKTDVRQLDEQEKRLIDIRNNCIGILAQLSLEGEARASELLAAIEEGPDYWGRVLAKGAVESVKNLTDQGHRSQRIDNMPFIAFHMELECALASDSLRRNRRVLLLDYALRNITKVYKEDNCKGNKRAVLLLIRASQGGEKDQVVREMMVKLYVQLAPKEDSKSLLEEIIGSPGTPAGLRKIAEYYRDLLD